MDTRDFNGKEVLGARLRYYRETAGLSILDLEKRTKVRRSHLYRIEAGKANFSIDLFEKLLRACGVSLSECLSGVRTSDVPAEAEDLYLMLGVIVNGHIPRQIDGIRVNLEAISLNVQRINARASPSPEKGVGGRVKAGTPREHKKNAS